jgi:hypothetical protein
MWEIVLCHKLVLESFQQWNPIVDCVSVNLEVPNFFLHVIFGFELEVWALQLILKLKKKKKLGKNMAFDKTLEAMKGVREEQGTQNDSKNRTRIHIL